jgi:polyisoprenoid-binding protein YceI
LPAILLIATIAATAGDKYQIDSVHSSVGFSVRHLVISNVIGNFTDFSGTIIYDSSDISKSSADVVIKAASINTDNVNRDDHLRSPDFLDVGKFPEITFKSSKIEKKGDELFMTGDFTLHGVTKQVVIPFTILGFIKDMQGNLRMGAEGKLTINRQDYGLTWSKTLETGGLVVGDEVKIELNIEAIKTQ